MFSTSMSTVSGPLPLMLSSESIAITPPRTNYLVANVPSMNEPLVSENPYIPSLNLSYSKPMLSVYENLNADPRIHHRLVKYFRLKILDKWLFEDMSKLLGYLQISKGEVSPISKLSEYKNNDEESDGDKSKKIKFIEDNVLSYELTYKILKRFVHGTNTNWYDLPKSELFVQQTFEIGIRKAFKKLILN